MRSIRELAPKPSDAITAMIDGLIEQSLRKDFAIDMGTFGTSFADSDICYGCAATCTLQKLAKIDFLPSSYLNNEDSRAELLGFDSLDVVRFERAINELRCGNLDGLLDYYGIVYDDIILKSELNKFELRRLSNKFWKRDLPNYVVLRDHLKEIGL